jgi:uroporphyrinogen-III synthase
MRLLITRPSEDADAFAELLRARGHVAVVAPTMEVRLHEGPAVPLTNVQAVLATSANGIRALAPDESGAFRSTPSDRKP